MSDKESDPKNQEATDKANTVHKFKEAFNAAVFGPDFIPGKFISEDFKTKKTSTKAQSEINQIIFILRHWKTGVNDKSMVQFRRDFPAGYELTKQYQVETYFLNGELEEKYRLRRLHPIDPQKSPIAKTGSLVAAAEGVFDVIQYHHEYLKHAKTARTWLKVKEYYHNISQAQIKAFIELCPTCFAGRTKRTSRNVKGASKPIVSESFRDRFQVDLVSYNKDPAKDHNNVIMLYIITIKDHCTGHIWLRPIRQKEAKLVATELKILFYEIGFPLIFHTDNGTEFMAEVYRLIKEAPITYSVHGRPRMPSDQGSVERGNREIRSAISHAIYAEFERSGNTLTWVDVLPEVQSSLNASSSHAKRGLTPYRHVFGMNFGCPLEIDHNDFPSLLTPSDLCGIVNQDEFSQKLERIGYDVRRMHEQKLKNDPKATPSKRKAGPLFKDPEEGSRTPKATPSTRKAGPLFKDPEEGSRTPKHPHLGETSLLSAIRHMGVPRTLNMG